MTDIRQIKRVTIETEPWDGNGGPLLYTDGLIFADMLERLREPAETGWGETMLSPNPLDV